MKYKLEEYAKALGRALEGADLRMQDKMVSRFRALIRRSGDWRFKEKIFKAAENELRSRAGGRNIIAEFARDTQLPSFLKSIKNPDRLQIKVNPGLVAGVRLSVDGKKEIDLSFRKKLQKLFS